MKKLFIVAVLGLLCTSAFAQTLQGTKAVSGSFSVGMYANNQRSNNMAPSDYSHRFLRIEPSIGYFLKDNLEAGASLGFETNRTKSVQDGGFSDFTEDSRTRGYSFSPYLKKYFSLTDKFALSARVEAGVDMRKTKTEFSSDYTVSTESDTKGYFAGISPGLTFFPTEKIGISTSFGSLGYSNSTTESGSFKSTSGFFGLNLSSSTLSFGFSYHFSR
ncbi:hypothetical protein H7F15_11760 [Pontibacter sp. Tf4]|uniref:outer membrane beta-barrel protein n=1 Tax=Pontibacter sp. Tf4 TaxID=2761620 RepID=UPI0016233704|nr:outer membrane beta-barrel protein [Pontibacter sp. Tf4]MBB6611716.1 hypothetical protein [Pontibacter sp. Tf4]